MNTLFHRGEDPKDEWLSPPKIFQPLGTFDLDPCSPVNRPWDTALKHYTIEDNGLIQPWFGRVWGNPPYSDIEPWMRLYAEHGNCIALTFARTETAWFEKWVWGKADSLFFIYGRLTFYELPKITTGSLFGADGRVPVKAKGNAAAPSVLIAYGKNNVEALHEYKIPGKHVQLTYTPIIVVGISPKWISVVTIAVKQFGDHELTAVYDMVERIAPDKVAKNQHWKAKVRQQIQVIRKKKFSL